MSDTAVVEAPLKRERKPRGEAKFEKQKEVVKSAIINATEQFRKKNGYDVLATTIDPLVYKLNLKLNICRNAGYSGYTVHLAQILSDVIGKQLSDQPIAGKTITWVRFGAMIVDAQGGHNYPIGKIIVITQDQKGIREDGTIGNTLDNNNLYYHPASLEDINKISNETYAALIREFLIMA